MIGAGTMPCAVLSSPGVRVHSKMSQRPLIITGCPRSGTLLSARVVGSAPGLFLVTEHSKKAIIPEDASGVIDSHLWWQGFDFAHWDSARARPLVETPLHDAPRIQKMREMYLAMAGDKRLVIKNPSHLTRLDILAEMFPDAAYLFCVRSPWHTIQSIAVKAVSKGSFLLRTERNLALPNDALLKAATSWVESIEIFEAARDARPENWAVSRYEDLLADPAGETRRLYNALGIGDEAAVGRAATLPQARDNNYHLIKSLFRQSPHRDQVLEMMRPVCARYDYSLDIDALPSSASAFHVNRVKKRLWRFL